MPERILTWVAKDYCTEKMDSSGGGSKLGTQKGVGVGADASWWNK